MRPRTKRSSLLTAGMLSAALAAGALGWYTAGLTALPAADPLLSLPPEAPAFTGSVPLTAPALRLAPDPLAPCDPAVLPIDGGSFGATAARDPLDLVGPVLDDLSIGPFHGAGPGPLDALAPRARFDPNAAALAAIRAAAAGSRSLDAASAGEPSSDPAPPTGDRAAPPPSPGVGDSVKRVPEENRGRSADKKEDSIPSR
jgi:hypothetical protein